MLTRHVIIQRADADGVDALTAERDYVLAHVIAQIHRAVPADGGRLIFKGGTALRFVHFGDYRYSADLDFSVIGGDAKVAVDAISNALHAAREHAGFPCLECASDSKPAISYVGPLGSTKPRRIKLDVTGDELVESAEQRTVHALWPDMPDSTPPISVYPLEEVSAEKLRCVIQRVQCRDLYDLWRLTEDMGIRLEEVQPLFERKTRAKGLDPSSFADRFEDRLDRYKKRWDSEMSEHIADPPRFTVVVREVRRSLRNTTLLES